MYPIFGDRAQRLISKPSDGQPSMTALVALLCICALWVWISIYYLRKYRREFLIKADHSRKLLLQKIELDTAITLMRQTFEKEKELYSKTLHDEVGNSLASIKLMVNALGRNLHEGDFDLVLSMQKQLDRTLHVIRDVSKDAYPHSLREYGLGYAIAELCDRLSNPRLTKITFEENEESVRLQPDYELVLYRATQELIGNAVKHSLAWYVNVSLEWSESFLIITVEDNGVGYGPWKTDKGGIGLKSIRSSLKVINASVFLDRERHGFLARITHPIYNGAYQDLYSRRS